jgi:hypothetical protein
MTRIEITPEGVGDLLDVSLEQPMQYGRTYVELRGGHPHVRDDGTYNNLENPE